MVCGCDIYKAFRVLVINTLLTAANMLFNLIGYSTNQWAIDFNTVSGCKSFVFIGLLKYKIGQSGDCNESVSLLFYFYFHFLLMFVFSTKLRIWTATYST